MLKPSSIIMLTGAIALSACTQLTNDQVVVPESESGSVTSEANTSDSAIHDDWIPFQNYVAGYRVQVPPDYRMSSNTFGVGEGHCALDGYLGSLNITMHIANEDHDLTKDVYLAAEKRAQAYWQMNKYDDNPNFPNKTAGDIGELQIDNTTAYQFWVTDSVSLPMGGWVLSEKNYILIFDNGPVRYVATYPLVKQQVVRDILSTWTFVTPTYKAETYYDAAKLCQSELSAMEPLYTNLPLSSYKLINIQRNTVLKYSITAPSEKNVTRHSENFTVTGTRWSHPVLRMCEDAECKTVLQTSESDDDWTESNSATFREWFVIPAGTTRYFDLSFSINSNADMGTSITTSHEKLGSVTLKDR